MDKAFIFLCKLAWEGRYRIPIIISIAFMVFDVSLQVEVNIQTRRIRRRPRNNMPIQLADIMEDSNSDDSWLTVDEETTSEASDEDMEMAVTVN